MKITHKNIQAYNNIHVIHCISFALSVLKVNVDKIDDVWNWLIGDKVKITNEHIEVLQTIYTCLGSLGADTKGLEEIIAMLKEEEEK